jgi:hypothetical protein
MLSNRSEELLMFRGVFDLIVHLSAFSLDRYRVAHKVVVTLEETRTHDLDNFHICLYDSRVGAPEWKIVTYIFCRVEPRNPTCGLMFWVRRVITRIFLSLCLFYA